jgi:hypothetical protein
MKIKHTLTAALAAVLMTGAAATSAAAAPVFTGGAFSGSSASGVAFSLGGSYGVTCQNVTLTGAVGNVPGDPSSTLVTPAFSDCDFFGWAGSVTSSGPWKLTVTEGSAEAAVGVLSLPEGSTVSFDAPYLAASWGYTDVQQLADVSFDSGGGQADLGVNGFGGAIAFQTGSGGMFGPGFSGDYGTVALDGVEFNGLQVSDQ